MKSICLGIKVIIRAVFVIIFLFIVGSYINHKIHLYRENKVFVPNGEIIYVNEYKIHVYTEGLSEIPLVFMSGGGTSSPVLDFKSLYTLLSDNHKIIVVERTGYGFSDVVDVDRDIDTVLDETRKSLEESGISGPFILLPHSMSGIEALYWAQKYPDEVKAIIGLDMAVPESYKEFKINIPMLKLGSFAASVGITRWIPSLAESDAIKYGTLTEMEKELYRVIFYRRTATITMINEMKEIKKSAEKVGGNKAPDIPILLFSSNGKGTGWNEHEWRRFQNDFIGKVDNGKIIDLDSHHYIHDIDYNRIAEETEEFIRSLHGSN